MSEIPVGGRNQAGDTPNTCRATCESTAASTSSSSTLYIISTTALESQVDILTDPRARIQHEPKRREHVGLHSATLHKSDLHNVAFWVTYSYPYQSLAIILCCKPKEMEIPFSPTSVKSPFGKSSRSGRSAHAVKGETDMNYTQ